MFDNTYLKLAGLYLLVLAVISFVFSANIYQLSVQELQKDLHMHTSRLNQFRVPAQTKALVLDEANDQYLSSKSRIVARLVVVNLFVLTAGGLLSYYLARLTLRPIEKAHKSLERFTADASHELRTPIAAMQTETEVTLMNPKLTVEEAKQQLQSNLEEMQKLTGLTETLLQVARFSESDLVNLESVKVSMLVKQATKKVEVMAKAKSINISATNIPGVMVKVDPDGIEQALIIILENAIKYSEKGQKVMVSVTHDKNIVKIAVKDKGKGIAKADLKNIFERFYRADSSRTKNDSGGYGLGLSIAKNIIQTNGGSISVDSVEGFGSVFTVTLKKAE